MSKIATIRKRLRENRLLDKGWLTIWPKCDDDRLVLCGITSESVYQIRIELQDDEKVLIEGSEGDYSHYGYVDGPILIQRTVESAEEAIDVVVSAIDELDVDEPPFSMKRTLEVLADADAVLITVEPRLLNTGLLVTPHISAPREEFVRLAKELGGIEINGIKINLDLEPCLDMSPTLGHIIAYSKEASPEGDIQRINPKLGAEKVVEEFSDLEE